VTDNFLPWIDTFQLSERVSARSGSRFVFWRCSVPVSGRIPARRDSGPSSFSRQMSGPLPSKSPTSFVIPPFDAVLCEYRQHRKVTLLTFLCKDDSRLFLGMCMGKEPPRHGLDKATTWITTVFFTYITSCSFMLHMCHGVGHLFQRGRYVRSTFKRFDTNAIDVTGFAGSFRLLGSETQKPRYCLALQCQEALLVL
jgi:hypothetical protein